MSWNNIFKILIAPFVITAIVVVALMVIGGPILLGTSVYDQYQYHVEKLERTQVTKCIVKKMALEYEIPMDMIDKYITRNYLTMEDVKNYKLDVKKCDDMSYQRVQIFFSDKTAVLPVAEDFKVDNYFMDDIVSNYKTWSDMHSAWRSSPYSVN